jgi:hypothetical protein
MWEFFNTKLNHVQFLKIWQGATNLLMFISIVHEWKFKKMSDFHVKMGFKKLMFFGGFQKSKKTHFMLLKVMETCIYGS